MPALVEAFLRNQELEVDRANDQERPGSMTITGRRPGKDVAEAQFVVSSSDTGTGLISMADGDTGLVMASRPITMHERKDAEVVGDGFLVALDGLVPIRNPNRHGDPMTMEQLADYYTCRVTQWPNDGKRITLYAPEDLSADLDVFGLRVLGGAELCPAVQRVEGDQAVVDAVTGDPDAIGLVSSAVAGDAEVPLGPDQDPAARSTPAALRAQQYPLTRRLVLYTSLGSSELARDFAAFTTSEPGQRIVEDEQFVRPPTVDKPGRCGPVAAFCAFVANADRLPYEVTFATAVSDPDPAARAIVAGLVADLRRRGVTDRTILVAGFADDQDSDDFNNRLSDERAAAVGALLPGSQVQTQGFGEVHPADTNDTDTGRSHNRRVEFWLAP